MSKYYATADSPYVYLYGMKGTTFHVKLTAMSSYNCPYVLEKKDWITIKSDLFSPADTNGGRTAIGEIPNDRTFIRIEQPTSYVVLQDMLGRTIWQAHNYQGMISAAPTVGIYTLTVFKKGVPRTYKLYFDGIHYSRVINK